MKLLIRNLSRATTEATLKAAFEAHGAVQSCTLIIDKETGKSKGFGFVEMPKAADAKAAMKTLNATEIDGCKIRVKKSRINTEDTTIGSANTGPYNLYRSTINLS